MQDDDDSDGDGGNDVDGVVIRNHYPVMMLAVDAIDDCAGPHELLQSDCNGTWLILLQAVRAIPRTI